eukprot:360641-Chlamydomonas_euryale.AAC.4
MLPHLHTSSTSALPHRLDTERLPCLATFAPAAAATMLAPVEMLTLPMPSPPVPTMSTTGRDWRQSATFGGRGGARKGAKNVLKAQQHR